MILEGLCAISNFECLERTKCLVNVSALMHSYFYSYLYLMITLSLIQGEINTLRNAPVGPEKLFCTYFQVP